MTKIKVKILIIHNKIINVNKSENSILKNTA